ncbi:hypothetical protein Leryth_017295 [Lithospermum erythrorhizon]|uniref:COBRA-like protein n=1 Tax=Lithospermum erythrorhizon TaxID=34254 RepID=A0AAV3RN19_LITER|nr:hypothetical protein Leryth_017295 [Lithospermum erythrorhizon]
MVNFSCVDGFDALDPNGNITIKWDVLVDNDGSSQDVRVTILNNQLYRHIDHPGWKLSWTWPDDGVIWHMTGAETMEQGNCYKFKGSQIPHCCKKKPVIIDLLPGVPYNKQVANCCKGGVLTSLTQEPDKNIAAFQMNIGSFKGTTPKMPENFTIGVRGYTCGDPFKVPPSKFTEDQGRRTTQALSTWNVTCSYSQFRASSSPKCCVSLSAFYNSTIVPCQKCSCACQGQSKCIKPGELPSVLQLQPNEEPEPQVGCTSHMCPIRIHWHVKQSYKEYWRVKITITNFNFVKNYTQWNLVVQHPNLRSIAQLFSFNYKPLYPYGQFTNDTGLFYGVQYYNDMLQQAGKNGNVQSEMLLHKDSDMFTFREGWGFPRKVVFNGEECVIPTPDDYPRLPNTANLPPQSNFFIFIFSMLLLPTIF